MYIFLRHTGQIWVILRQTHALVLFVSLPQFWSRFWRSNFLEDSYPFLHHPPTDRSREIQTHKIKCLYSLFIWRVLKITIGSNVFSPYLEFRVYLRTTAFPLRRQSRVPFKADNMCTRLSNMAESKFSSCKISNRG